MLRWLLCVTVVAFLRLAGQTAPGPAQFSQDLSFVANDLPRLHPNLYANVSRAEFDSGVRRLENEYQRLSPEEFYTRLGALIALARDGHTNLYFYLESREAAAAGFVPLPIQFRWFADGIYVIAAAADRAALLRARLVHIGGTPVNEVTERVRTVIPHENQYFFRFLAPTYLRNAGVLRGLGLAPLAGPIRLGLRLESGEETVVEMLPGAAGLVPAPDPREGYIPASMTRSSEAYWSEYWPHAKTVYIRWNQFRPMSTRPAEQFATETAALIDRNPVETLVFDVRGNTGGNSSLMMPLLMELSLRITALKSNPRFRMYGLVDGGTYSSSLMAAEFLVLPAVPPELGPLPPEVVPFRATLAGEPTGGKPAHFGEVLNFTLPGSRIMGQHSTRYFELWTGIPDRDSLYPELQVEFRSTDYFARHDPVLAAVVGHVSSLPAAPAGTALVVNSASFRPETGVAAGSFASAFGTFPSGTVQVTVGGRTATVVGAASSQINFLVPAETPAGSTRIEVRQGGQVAASGQFQVTTAGPGIFVMNAALGTQPGAVLNEDSLLNARDAPATRDSILQIYGTGYGPLTSTGAAEVEVWIAERPAAILYSGPAPGYPGLWQINARVPNDTVIAGQVPVCLKAHGLVSNGVTVFVRR